MRTDWVTVTGTDLSEIRYGSPQWPRSNGLRATFKNVPPGSLYGNPFPCSINSIGRWGRFVLNYWETGEEQWLTTWMRYGNPTPPTNIIYAYHFDLTEIFDVNVLGEESAPNFHGWRYRPNDDMWLPTSMVLLQEELWTVKSSYQNVPHSGPNPVLTPLAQAYYQLDDMLFLDDMQFPDPPRGTWPPEWNQFWLNQTP